MALKSRPLPSIVIYACTLCIGVFYLLSAASGQSTCASRFISEANLTDVLFTSSGISPEYEQQRVIPDIAFTCNGAITKWIVGAVWKTAGQRSNFPHLQIWRNISDTSYTLVNSIIFTAAGESSNKIYEFTPDPPLGFQAGDVLGIFQPQQQTSRLRIYHEQDTGSINYFVNTGMAPSTNFSIATADSEMTRPLVTVEIIIDCGNLTDPEGGQIMFTPGVVTTTDSGLDAVANYSCNEGYNLDGNEIRTCQGNGQWDGAAPNCTLIDCGGLTDPEGGQVLFTPGMVTTIETGLGAVATYSCNASAGYMLFGTGLGSTRTCQDSGLWSGVAGICTQIDCGNLTDPEGGQVTFTPGVVTTIDTGLDAIAAYTCDQGYDLVGDEMRTCQENEQWTGADPNCTRLLSTGISSSLIFHPSLTSVIVSSISDTPTSLAVEATSFTSDVQNSPQTMLTTVGSMLAISFSSSISEQSISMLISPVARVATTLISSGSQILSTPVARVATTLISSGSQILSTPVARVATTLISSGSQILSTPASEVATSFIRSTSQLPVSTTTVPAPFTSGSQQPTLTPVRSTIVATSFSSSSSQLSVTSPVDMVSTLPATVPINSSVRISQALEPTVSGLAISFSSSISEQSISMLISPVARVATALISSGSQILSTPASEVATSFIRSASQLPVSTTTPLPPSPETDKMTPTPVIIAVTVSVFFVGLIAIIGILIALVIRRWKKHRLAFYDLSSLDLGVNVHNPTYQGVTSANRRIISSSSYNMYAIPGQQNPDSFQKSETDITVGQHYEIMDSTVVLVPNTGRSPPSQKTAASRSEGTYETPAKDEELLYGQLKKIGIKRISADTVRIGDHLGSGQFGVVSKGEWESPDGPVEVAVKTSSDNANKIKLLQEATIMGQFSHPNIVQLHGMVISRSLMMIVLELLAKGDLRKYLIALRPNSDKKTDDYLGHTLLSFCRQIASGLSYLAEKAFVHRDLAARNILVGADNTCKVADFGMSRDLVDENYYTASAGQIPIKWTAPEALHFKKYSTASDVWSYGVLMYEIWSLGHKPFEGYSNHQTISVLDSGHRLPPPPGCPRAIYDIMIKCWHPTNNERPDAAMIAQWLSHPDPQLLRWSEEDRALHPEASLLGAELEATVELYKELQETYKIRSD